jgi:two-component system KDP operon response regulator KdpE
LSRPKVLVIDDEPAIRRFLRASLEAEGYELLESGSGSEGLAMAATHVPQLIIVDLSLPDMDGAAVVGLLREWTQVPVIVLTVRDSERDKVQLLDSGADDYLTKPFSTQELLARIRVALRHATPAEGHPVFSNGFLEIHYADRSVTCRGETVKLSALEFNLLTLLARHVGKLVPQKQLLKEVWGPGSVERSEYLRVYVGRLRRKLEPDPAKPALLLTEPGIGYRMALLD